MGIRGPKVLHCVCARQRIECVWIFLWPGLSKATHYLVSCIIFLLRVFCITHFLYMCVCVCTGLATVFPRFDCGQQLSSNGKLRWQKMQRNEYVIKKNMYKKTSTLTTTTTNTQNAEHRQIYPNGAPMAFVRMQFFSQNRYITFIYAM